MFEQPQPWPLPDVGDELIIPFDLFDVAPVEDDLHAGWHTLHDGPDIFYTPLNGGHWVATRAQDIYEIFRDSDRFSNHGVALFREQHGARFIPGEIDPPMHGAFRKALNPETSPRRIQSFEQTSRSLSGNLIEALVDRGECEFHDAVAEKMPIYNFLTFMSLPIEDAEILLPHVAVISRSSDMNAFAATLGALHAYVDDRMDERIATHTDDFIGRLLSAEVDGRPITRDECRVTILNVMLGGLDTVTGSMGFFMNFLARHPDHRRRLADNPALIPEAIEELLRRHGIFNTGRLVKQDCDYNGIRLRENDLILLPTSLHNLDERRFHDPLTVDFERSDKNHLTFGVGIHRCLGSNFARAQLRILLEEWFQRIPDFSIAPDAAVIVKSGRANSILSLPLAWDSQRTALT